MPAQRRPHLGEMTHAALCAVCEPNGWEAQIERIGCASTLVVATILGAIAPYFAWATGSVIESLAAGFAVFVGCSVALTFVLFHLAKRRRAPFRAELWRRLPQPFAIDELDLTPWTVIDGSGCSLVIVKRDPVSEKAIHANLGSPEAGPETPPAVRLLLVIRDSIERFESERL